MRAYASRRRPRGPVAAVLGAVSLVVLCLTTTPQATAGATAAETVHGTVSAGGQPLAHAQVALLSASVTGSAEIGHATTNQSGDFTISYPPPGSGVTYLDATSPASPRLRLRSVVGFDGSGGVPATTQSAVTVNELTTVAAGYALAQFSSATGVSGPSPGLPNAAATAFSLADPTTGAAGSVVSDQDNGSHNATLATLGTLADLVSLCAPGQAGRCGGVLRHATPPGSAVPTDTVAAVVNLARNPTVSPAALFALTRKADVYHPTLSRPPAAWALTLLYTQQNLYASGRIAIDAQGNLWSSNNWLPGGKDPSPYVSVLSPVGRPVLGSPLTGGGMKGGAWGAAIAPSDGSVWMGSFGGSSISQYSPSGQSVSPSGGWTNGTPNHPQGVAVDQRGNVWIANNYGPESQPGQGNVLVYPGGDPSKVVTITGGGLNHPFAVQIDGQERAWVTNAGLGGSRLVGTKAAILVGKFSGSVTVIDPDFKPTSFSPIQDTSFKWPLGLSIDSQGNAWTANYFSSTVTEIRPSGDVADVVHLPHGSLPWSQAVDGSGRVWVAGFGRPRVWLLCGASTSTCPPGSKTGTMLSPRNGFASAAFQHFTSVQLDQSGNAWLSNNWSQLVPPVGGVGIAQMVGVATPVCTPLTPLPVKPASADRPCPDTSAAAASPPSTATDGASERSSGVAWSAIALGCLIVILGAGAWVLVRRRRGGRPA